MYIGPNWRVSDSPRKNEDKLNPLKFEKTFFIPKDFFLKTKQNTHLSFYQKKI